MEEFLSDYKRMTKPHKFGINISKRAVKNLNLVF